MNIRVGMGDNVLCVIKNIITGKERIVKGHNIVTNAGDEHYARLINGETSNIGNTFYLRLGTSSDNPTKDDIDVSDPIDNSGKAVSSDFPKRDYTDEGNSDGGVNVITYKIEYDTGEIVENDISEGALCDDPDEPEKALNHFLFDESFDLTDADQLIVYVNHSFVGV